MYAVRRARKRAKPGGTAGMIFQTCPSKKNWDRFLFSVPGKNLHYVPPKTTKTERRQKTMAHNEIPYKIYLTESEMPTYWYNLRADMKNKPAPLLNPGTGKPMTAEELGGGPCVVRPRCIREAVGRPAA